MKKIGILLAVLLMFCQDEIFAQTKLMQITTLESVVGGGLGRSKMIITDENGVQTEKSLENLFSMVGINMGNIKGNESAILNELKTYMAQGWKLMATIPLTVSPSKEGGSVGIFMTRYLLSKD